MRVLFLDDEEYRHKLAPEFLSFTLGVPKEQLDITHVYSAVNAEKVLGAVNYFPTVLSLDHDLGEAHYMDDYVDGATGLDFVKWLVKNKSFEYYDYPTVIVHSHNYHRGTEMVAVLNEHGWRAVKIPFHAKGDNSF